MEQHFEHRFAAPIDRVVALYADPDFGAARAAATGAIDSDVDVDGDPESAFTVSIRRTMATADIQPEFRGLIGETLHVRYTEAWEAPDAEAEGDGRAGTFALEIVGAPARAAGQLEVSPDGDGTLITIDTVVAASVPFLQQLVVAAVAGALEKGIAQEFAVADEWLARN